MSIIARREKVGYVQAGYQIIYRRSGRQSPYYDKILLMKEVYIIEHDPLVRLAQGQTSPVDQLHTMLLFDSGDRQNRSRVIFSEN